MNEDIRNVPENAMARELNIKTGEITKSKGGWVGAPELRWSAKLFNCLGHYVAGLRIGGHFIELRRERELHEIRDTFVHETLHWVDDMSKQESGQHDCYWQDRLKLFRLMLGMDKIPKRPKRKPRIRPKDAAIGISEGMKFIFGEAS